MANKKVKEVITLVGSRGKNIQVCACHASLVEKYKWHVLQTDYAARSTWKPRRMIYMHRVIAGAPKNKVVDHINGDSLFNACWNLRIVTQSQNIENARFWKHNTSGFKGVAWHKQQECWRAYIMVDGKQKSLGLYDDIADAVVARKRAEEELFGVYSYSAR